MIIPEFKYHQPSTLEEILEIKDDLKDKALILAGGTDLVVNMKKGTVKPENLISLKGIKDSLLSSLNSVSGAVQIGASVTAAQLSGSEYLKGTLEAVATSAASLGSPLIRNLATVGGNIITARPAADLIPPLIACDASVILSSISGTRVLPLDGFIAGPGKTRIKDNELLESITVNSPSSGTGCSYIKLGIRKALEISLVNVAVFINIESPDGTVSDARIVLGSVGPTPLRAKKSEQSLVGQKSSEKLFEKAGEIAAGECIPVDDFRGSAEYRRDMAKVLTLRALKKALSQAENNN